MVLQGVYKHYKGHSYKVIGTAKHSETLEDMVIYQDLIDASKTWVRPLKMFEESVTVDGVQKKRFEKII